MYPRKGLTAAQTTSALGLSWTPARLASTTEALGSPPRNTRSRRAWKVACGFLGTRNRLSTSVENLSSHYHPRLLTPKTPTSVYSTQYKRVERTNVPVQIDLPRCPAVEMLRYERLNATKCRSATLDSCQRLSSALWPLGQLWRAERPHVCLSPRCPRTTLSAPKTPIWYLPPQHYQ